MNIKVISRYVGYALLVSALFMFLSILVSVANGNDSALAALMISFTLTFTVGIFPFFFVRKTSAINLKEGYLIIVLSWILSFIFGMLPYALWGGPFTIVNAWFESVSGFTTTGATILEDVESLPNSLIFWRSSTHFIGGLGVVVFLLLIIPSSSQMKLRLTNLELSSLSKSGYRSGSGKIVYIFTYVYFGMAVASFLLYMLAGMSPFDAVNHAMSVTATGGFSTRNLSIGSYNSIPIDLITMFFMLLSSVHFGMTYVAIITKSLKPFRNEVFKFYVWNLLIVSMIVSVSLKIQGVEQAWGQAFLSGSFHVLSYASTSGFGIGDNSTWPVLPSVMLVFAGITCGMAGSTSGGIKCDRVLVLLKEIKYRLRCMLHPASVNEVRVNGRVVNQEVIAPHILYLALYLLLIIFSLALNLLFNPHNTNAVAATFTSLSNVGPSVGELGAVGNFNAEPVGSKIMYTIDMFLGRVEIYPVLAVVMMVFSKRSK
ncbi:MAG: TrkH family potassium uptake protein [Bacteroidales bacterium]|nr:TrkH family potassium uptake protein [Bacteroidales bacterium]MBQ5979225.1 TrkH family potassium uptake protein [Bacteroidales bacterium]MBQ6184566.1 TrkH family potassium uptake protein [Bacteroidales bacterium]